MKKRIILFTSVLAIGYLSLSSNSTGPAQGNINGTGFNGVAQTQCVSCHGGGAGTTVGNVAIRLKSAGMSSTPVVNYYPDSTYIVTVTATNSNFSNFGFQLVAVSAGNTVGTYSNIPSNVHTVSFSGKMFIEHQAVIPATSGQMTTSFDWKAPNPGTNAVTFHGVVNAVNANGQITGDKPSNTFAVTLNQGSPTSVSELSTNINLKTYPNPVTDQLNIELDNADNGTYAINVFDMNGKVVASKTANVSKSFQTSINTSSWAAGMYHVQLSKDGAKKTIAVVKQ